VLKNNLGDALNKAFSNISQENNQEINRNIFEIKQVKTNNMNGNFNMMKETDNSYNSNLNSHNDSNNKKSYPANIDMLFDS
jgi:hypothetical protein